MNEIQRLAYLDALGIDAYVSRRQLPAAAPSRRLRIVRPVQAGATEPRAEPLTVAPQPPVLATSPARETGLEESTPVFSVAASYLGGCYWLDEIPRSRDPGASYARLLQEICLALGLDPGAPIVDRFNWPMHHNRQLDQGQEAARHGFEGFIRARLEQYPVRAVVLLGEPEGGWFDPGVFSGLQLVRTVGAWRMLKQPELKNVAWCDLQPLRQARK